MHDRLKVSKRRTPMRYTLRNVGLPHKIITQGRKRVGTVWQHADTKVWHGAIGKHTTATGATELEAFNNVAAKVLGFENVDALRNHNARTRAKRRVSKATAQGVLDDMLRGDFTSLDKLLGLK